MMFGLLSSPDRRSLSLAARSSRYSPLPALPSPEEQSLAQKVSRIALLNLQPHDLEICACEECIYGRQLNRKHRIALDLSKHSSYRAHYDPLRALPDANPSALRIDHDALEKPRSKSPVVERSSYGGSYSKEEPYGKPERKRPEDELRFEGPVKGFSAYAEQFPAFRNNASPYVKPTEVSVPNTLRMNLRSVYQANFSGAAHPPAESGKHPDSLRGGLPWTGGSTYRQLFKGTAPSLPREPAGRAERRAEDPAYLHQYETTYRNEYLLGRKKCSRGEQQTNPLLERLQRTLDL